MYILKGSTEFAREIEYYWRANEQKGGYDSNGMWSDTTQETATRFPTIGAVLDYISSIDTPGRLNGISLKGVQIVKLVDESRHVLVPEHYEFVLETVEIEVG